MGSHFVGFVQHKRLSSWIIRAVTPVVGSNLDDDEQRAWAEQATRDHHRLGSLGLGQVWPWAYSAGATPLAGTIQPGDVLWVFGKMSALQREWPPSLVARMGIREVHPGPTGWELWRENRGKGTHPGFPFADAHRFYADPRCSRFYAYNNAVPCLLGLHFGTERKSKALELREDTDPRTINGAVEAWKHASTTADGYTRFRTLRRLLDSSGDLLEQYAAGLDHSSVFLSYSWADHDEHNPHGRRALQRLRRLSEGLVEHRVAVWLDRLMLPESKLKDRQRDHVLSKILGDGIERANALLAMVTKHYGGPSSRGGVQPGYTAREWRRAEHKDRLRWEIEECAFENELGGDVTTRFASASSAKEVATATGDFLTEFSVLRGDLG